MTTDYNTTLYIRFALLLKHGSCIKTLHITLTREIEPDDVRVYVPLLVGDYVRAVFRSSIAAGWVHLPTRSRSAHETERGEGP